MHFGGASDVGGNSRAKMMIRPPRVGFALDPIWADKAALVMAGFILVVAILSSLVLFIGVGTVGDVRLDQVLLAWTIMFELVVALPLWLVLRAIDWFNGGPQRRRASRNAGR